MASDATEVLPDELRRWVDEKAEELGLSREDVLTRALAAFRAVEEDGEADPALVTDVDEFDDRLSTLDERVAAVEREGIDSERVEELAERVEELTERLSDVEVTAEADEDLRDRLDALDDRVDDLDAELDEKIDDVRERVIQVKRETDAKAPADHDHRELRRAAERAADGVDDLRERIDDLDGRVDEGFDNFEEVLEYLTETSDDLEDRTTRLARATVDLRDRVADLETERSARAVADDIRAKANRNGDASATCESCSRTVRIGLLSRPECPHCDATFEDVEPSSGLFGSATLVAGRPPALEGETTTAASPDELFADGENGEGAPADE
ncbi:MAG: hypothetical protein ABEH47_01930 [Haloferacaceae archaeon]